MAQVADEVLACDVLEHGCARIRCDVYAHEYVLAFSCACRYFCPSCHAKRVALWTPWLDATLLAPVSHLHLLVTDGGVRPDGTFVALPAHATARLTVAVRRAVLRLFVRLHRFDEDHAAATAVTDRSDKSHGPTARPETLDPLEFSGAGAGAPSRQGAGDHAV